MSKAKLIGLIKGSQEDVYDFFAETPTYEVQNILRLALKDQDRDTRHGCAISVSKLSVRHLDHDGDFCVPLIRQKVAQQVCLNYQDKSLEGL